MSRSSAWPTIVLIAGAGVVSAFQVGKAPMALVVVQADLGISLATASWLISAFAVVGALAGAPIGLVIDRIGARRMAIAGLLLQSVGSMLGALAPGIVSLLASRALEGVGFLGLVVAAPTLIAHAVPARIHDRAMAVWATFMPVGMTVIMLAAPLLGLLSWRGFWLLNAAVLLAYAVLLAWRVAAPASRATHAAPILNDIRAAMAAPAPRILGGLFAFFAATFFALFGFLPPLLAERFESGLEAASMLSAAAIAVSGVGNLVCGRLLARGCGPSRLLFVSFGAMALCGLIALGAGIPATIAYAGCIVFAFFGGFAPVVILDSAVRYAPRPELVGVTIGFAMQGNNFGLLSGPVAASSIAAAFGWPSVALLIVAVCGVATLLVALFQRVVPGVRRQDAARD